MLYPVFYFLWEFKIKTYKLDTWYIKHGCDSISYSFLWSKEYYMYKTYFHCIWNLQNNKPILTQLTNRIKLLCKR